MTLGAVRLGKGKTARLLMRYDTTPLREIMTTCQNGLRHRCCVAILPASVLLSAVGFRQRGYRLDSLDHFRQAVEKMERLLPQLVYGKNRER